MSHNESLNYTNTQSPSRLDDLPPPKPNSDVREKSGKDERNGSQSSSLKSEKQSPAYEQSPTKIDYFTTGSNVPLEYSLESNKRPTNQERTMDYRRSGEEPNRITPFERNYSQEEQELSTQDYVAMKTAVLNDLISVKNQKRSPQKRTPRETQSPDGFFPRYISKKDRITLTMKGPNTFQKSPGEVSSPVSERKIPPKSFVSKKTGPLLEPQSPIPEEKAMTTEGFHEQRFVEEADVPKKLNVKMEENFHDDSRDYPAAYQSSQGLSSGKKEPKSNRKAEIKKNMGNYEPFKPEKPHVFSNNIFEDLGLGNEKESSELLDRLKSRYEKIYRDQFLIDRHENKKYHPNESKRIKSPNPNQSLPFVSPESVRDSQLIASLISPAKSTEVRGFEDYGEEFREFRSQEQLYRSPNRGYLEGTKKKESPHKKAGVHPIFKNFERETVMRNLGSERTEENQTETKINQSNRSGPKSSVKKKQPKVQDISKVEDLLLELQRTVTSNGGNLTNPLSSKIVKLISSQPVVNNYQSKKRDNELKINEEENDSNNKSESQVIKDQLEKLAPEFNPKQINYFLKPFKDDKVRLLAWSCIISMAGAYEKDIKITNQHFSGTFDDCINFINQPGKVSLSIKSIGNNIEKKGILKTLHDDFNKFFNELQEELEKDKTERKDEMPLFRLIYLIDSLVKALDGENKLKIEYNNQQKINLNHKANSEYLENAKRRREEMGDRKPEEDDEEDMDKAYGIDFAKWEENLKALEMENKLLAKFENEKQWKEEKKSKFEVVKAQKEEQEKEIVEYIEESKKEKEQQLIKQKKKQEEKKEFYNEKVEFMKHQKKVNKVQQAQIEHEEREKLAEQKLFQDELKKREQELLKMKIKENEDKIAEDKKFKSHQKNVNKQIEKEEKVWKKAQELLEKQKRLLQERDKLTYDLKLLK